MKRTTIRLDDELLAQVRQLAVRSGRTLTSVVEDALRRIVGQRPPGIEPAPVVIPTFEGDGIQPGVDLDDNSALIEVMERTAHPSV